MQAIYDAKDVHSDVAFIEESEELSACNSKEGKSSAVNFIEKEDSGT
jgi:hypothetical protein